MSRLINSMNVECLIPHMLTNKNTRSFTCKISQLAKHTPIYPSVLPHPYKTFAMVHSNIWGSFRKKNINEAQWFVTFADDHTRIGFSYERERSQRMKEYSKHSTPCGSKQINTTGS